MIGNALGSIVTLCKSATIGGDFQALVKGPCKGVFSNSWLTPVPNGHSYF